MAAAPLLYAILRDLRNASDLALRHAAAQSLSRFVQAASQAPYDPPLTTATDAKHQHQQQQQQDVGALHPIVTLERKTLYPQLKRGLGANSLSVRQEHLSLLRLLALKVPERYSDLQPLVAEDEEVDFLLNIGHLQYHRRARALARLAKMIRSDRYLLSMSVMVGVLLPLLQQVIAEGKGAADTDAGHEAKQSDKDKESNVTDSAIGTLSVVAGALPWVQYQQILGQYLRLMHKHAEGTGAKPVLRAVCAILDAFHFTPVVTAGTAGVDGTDGEGHIGVDEEDTGMETSGAVSDDDEEEGIEDGMDVGEESLMDAVPAEDIYRLLSK